MNALYATGRIVATDLGRDDQEVLVFGRPVGTPDTWVEIGSAADGLNFISEFEYEDDWTPEVLARGRRTISVVGSTRNVDERYLQILFGTHATIDSEVRRLWPAHQEAVMPTMPPSPRSPHYSPPPFSGGYFAADEPEADLEGSTHEAIHQRLVFAASRDPIPLREDPGCDSMRWKAAEDEKEDADADRTAGVPAYLMGSPA